MLIQSAGSLLQRSLIPACYINPTPVIGSVTGKAFSAQPLIVYVGSDVPVPNCFEQHLECMSVRYAKYPREDLCWNVQNAVY